MFNISPEEFEEYQKTKLPFPPKDESKEEATRLAKFRAVDFFTEYPTTELQKSAGAHKRWAEVVSNLEGVEYRRGGESDVDNFAEIAGMDAEEGAPNSLNAVIKHLTGKENIEELAKGIDGSI